MRNGIVEAVIPPYTKTKLRNLLKCACRPALSFMRTGRCWPCDGR